MSGTPTSSAVSRLLGSALDAGPDETLFWSGAGISADAPTSGPVGTALADRALAHAFASTTATTIASYYSHLQIKRSRPRLETLLDVVYRVHGERVLNDLLSDLASAMPNGLHRFFADHLALRGHHITANFDTCIERSLAPSPPDDVLHFHGSFASAPLGATLSRIERGFAPQLSEELSNLLTAAGTKLLLFVGYSGLDFFDVDPFLRALPPNCLVGQTAIWVNHAHASPTLAAAGRKQLAWLNAAGAATIEINALTRDVVAALAIRWGVDLTSPRGAATPWTPTISLTPAEKERATLELYALMNLHKEVLARVTTPTTATEWGLLASALWAGGQYSEAGLAWEQARAGGTDPSRRERRAAVLWIRGEFRKARRELLQGLDDKTLGLEERMLLAELLARLLTHMRRFPDTRFIPSQRVRQRALSELPDPEYLTAAGTPLGTHLRIRLCSARATLGIAPARDHDAIANFDEYGALGARLNYRHAALRQKLAHRQHNQAEIRQLEKDFRTIGAFGDAARTTLLGGIDIFGWKNVFRATRALQVTRWHRVRLLTASLSGSLRRRLRRR